MPFKVMDAVCRLADGGCQRTRRTRPNQQRPCKARPAGIGDETNSRRFDGDWAKYLSQQRQHAPDVIAGRQFGDDASVGRMHSDLAVQCLSQKVRRRIIRFGTDQRYACFVTGGLDAQDTHQTDGTNGSADQSEFESFDGGLRLACAKKLSGGSAKKFGNRSLRNGKNHSRLPSRLSGRSPLQTFPLSW